MGNFLGESLSCGGLFLHPSDFEIQLQCIRVATVTVTGSLTFGFIHCMNSVIYR